MDPTLSSISRFYYGSTDLLPILLTRRIQLLGLKHELGFKHYLIGSVNFGKHENRRIEFEFEGAKHEKLI